MGISLLSHLQIKQFNGKAHFVETFIALVRRAYNVQELDTQLYNQIAEQLLETFPTLKEVAQESDEHGVIQTIAATKMQALMRGHRVRKDHLNSDTKQLSAAQMHRDRG